MYEYVTKAEYKPVKIELEKIIVKVQSIMRKEYDTTFQYHLIGSGQRHLVTRIVGGNGGYDFDYNLIIPAPQQGYYYKADVVKQQFMNAFRKALKGTQYSDPQDSTSAITIKVVDKQKSRIVHSCDFAIIYYDRGRVENGYYYLKHNKGQGQYVFEIRGLSKNIEDKIAAIREYRNGWNAVRDEYLNLKNKNRDKNKHSFSLYNEAVNNVYNNLPDDDEYDDDDDYYYD